MTNYRLSQRKRSRKSVVEFLFHKNIDRAKRQFPKKNSKVWGAYPLSDPLFAPK